MYNNHLRFFSHQHPFSSQLEANVCEDELPSYSLHYSFSLRDEKECAEISIRHYAHHQQLLANDLCDRLLMRKKIFFADIDLFIMERGTIISQLIYIIISNVFFFNCNELIKIL
jgi:hypothetical protein